MSLTKSDPCGKTVWVTLYRSLAYGWYSVFESDGPEPVEHSDYLRVSEPTGVVFTPLQSDEAVRAALATLDAAEAKVRGELAKALAAINDQRASLRALTHPVSEESA